MPFLLLVEMVFHPDGEAAFAQHLPRMLAELRGTAGCLSAAAAHEPGGRHTFTTIWADDVALQRWVDHPFHQSVLMPSFRHWATEAWFSRWELADDRPRVRRCRQCSRWTRGRPGWAKTALARCAHCGGTLE